MGGRAWEEAEAIGLKALVFLTEDPGRLGRFLSETGISPAELRAMAATPEGLVSVLDHVLADESLLLVLAAEAGVDPAAIGPARETLAGSPQGGAGRSGMSEAKPRQSPKRASRRWPGPGA